MSVPRGLSEQEAAAWARLAHSVTPLDGRKMPVIPQAGSPAKPAPVQQGPQPVQPTHRKPSRPAPIAARRTVSAQAQAPRQAFASKLDSHWDRKLKSGRISPDYTLDLHGHSLDTAYTRLVSGLEQARAMNARIVLLIAGKPRPVDPADRGQRRGAIRAKLLDWLAAGPHAETIAAVRPAHRSHGGEGALYLVLKRRR